MDNTEDVLPDGAETRRTRSGRALRTPVAAAAPLKPVGRKTRKKMVLVEVEVSDEEEHEKESMDEKDDEKLENSIEQTDIATESDAIIENSDPLLENTDDVIEQADAVIERSDAVIEATDNAVEASDMQEASDVQFDDSNSATNDFNSFQGAESSTDLLNNESNSFEFRQQSTENGVDNTDTNAQSDEDNIEKEKDDTVAISEDKIESDVEEIFEEKEKMDEDDDEKEIDEQIIGDNLEEVEKMEEEVEKIDDEEDKLQKQNGHDANMDEDEEIENKLMQVDPDAENISEDELPSVQVVKVPETEEVSDEELPGPKRAELPADTEVVSEDELETVKKESNKRKLAEGDYDPGSPTSENGSASKKPALETTDEAEEEEKDDKPKKLPELDKYWKAVNDDPSDFTGWTYLLQYVDQENDMEAAREAYDAFLSHYPYCYGYWRKYADYEKRKGNKKKCEEVFERGLKAIPLSVDLWIHYLTYVKNSKPEEEDYIRSQFERSLSSCGLEFRSDRLWEHYIKWESEGKRLQIATTIYERLLSNPTQGYLQHFDNFQEHVMSNSPNKILEVDEFLALRKEVKSLLKPDVADMADNPDIPPGEDNDEVNSDEETKAIRERIISIRRKMHKNTSAAVTARWNYEEGIKRPYFHVKPLERCQLKNWQEYLDYEITQGDQSRIIVLFERCLIACALYEEFWLRFVHYLQGLNNPEHVTKIKDVYERACTIHHLKKPNIHLQWAMFEESVKNFNKAAEILQHLDQTVPNLLQVAYRRINLERRREDNEKCCQLYEHYITNSKNKVISANLAIKYSRFTLKAFKDTEKALEILNAAVAKDPNNSRLHLQLIDVTLHKDETNEQDVIDIIDAFLEKEGTESDQKAMFAQRKLEFLEDYGSDIQMVQKAYEDYQKYLKSSKDVKKKDTKNDVAKKDKNTASTTSASNYSSYGNYGNSAQGSYQYGNSQQGAYGQYPQYGQSDQYQYGNWQYQGNYTGYNQWGGYGSGYSY